MNPIIAECTKCHYIKELAKGKKWCKQCKNEYEHIRRSKQSLQKKQKIKEQERQRYYKKRDKMKKIKLEVDLTKMKQCSICKIEKTLDNYHLAKNKGTIRAMCKSCSSIKRKEYYKKHRKEIIKQTNKYKVERMKKDSAFKLKLKLRNRLYSAFKSQGLYKKERTIQYLGCKLLFFKEWIEYMLYDGMTIDNYGKYWHLDHVIPCTSFNLENKDESYKCFNWRNIRPYLAHKNLVKSNKIIQRDILFQELKVKCFLRYKMNGSEKQLAQNI